MSAEGANQPPRIPIWGIALLTFSGTLGMYVLVPALSQAADELFASNGAIQLTIGLYVLGLASGQLLYGPISDRFGRRPVLIAALSLFVAASLVAMLAQSTLVLIAARLAQGLGGCAGLVLGRVIVRDVFPSRDAAGRIALLNIIMTSGPGLAPIIGGFLTAASGWRSIFAFLALLGVGMLVFVWRIVPETRALRIDDPRTGIMKQYLHLLGSPIFMGYAVGGGCVTTAVYAVYTALPFIFSGRLRLPPQEVGFYLAVISVGIVLGNVATSGLVRRFRLASLVTAGSTLSLLAAIGILVVALSGEVSVPLVLGPAWLFAFAVGLAGPASITLAVDFSPDTIGSASGLYGFTQMLIGAACASAVGIGTNPALAMGIVLVIAAIVQQFAFYIARRAAPSNRA